MSDETRYLVADQQVTMGAGPVSGHDETDPDSCWWYMPVGSMIRGLKQQRSGLWCWEYSHNFGRHWHGGHSHRRPKTHLETDEEAASRRDHVASRAKSAQG